VDMVSSVTNLGRRGLYDWLVQRFSAVILASYCFCLLGSFVVHPDMDYLQWKALFDSNTMRIYSLITLLSLCAHAWVGMWIISTDYLTPMLLGNRATFVRLFCQVGSAILIAIYLIWGVQILWGN